MPQKRKEYVINYLGIEIKIQKLYVRTFDFSRVGKNCKLQFPKKAPKESSLTLALGKKKKTNGVTFQQHDAAVRKCPDEWVMAEDGKKKKFF